MPLDPAKVTETGAWLSKAVLDLRAAEHERTATPPLTGDMVFSRPATGGKEPQGLPELVRPTFSQNP